VLRNSTLAHTCSTPFCTDQVRVITLCCSFQSLLALFFLRSLPDQVGVIPSRSLLLHHYSPMLSNT
jgi:hypothetical protein